MGDMTCCHPDRYRADKKFVKLVAMLIAMNFGPITLIYLFH